MEWIDLKKQTPKDDEDVLVCTETAYRHGISVDVECARWNEECKKFSDVENSTVYGVKHWMHLPEPPKRIL